MVITGERTVPGIWHENYWFRRHEVVYEQVAAAVAGCRVLEAGSGEGYGADLMRRAGAEVIGLDYDLYAATHAARAYPGLEVVRGNLVALPFADGSFDHVVSLQTIEHLWDQDAFMAECVRVTRPGGRITISTPNTLTFPPGNIYHPRELRPDELETLATSHGDLLSMTGLHHGGRLQTWEALHGSLVDAQIAGEPGTWSPDLAAMVRSVTTGDFERHDEALQECLDLIAVLTPRS